jgi:hypothetical protein
MLLAGLKKIDNNGRLGNFVLPPLGGSNEEENIFF